jgi:hypothetical protein
VLSRPPAFILSQDQTLRVVEFFWLTSSFFHSALKAGFFPLTFFSLFAILSSAFAFTLYLDFFDEVNNALSFQTILFSRFSALGASLQAALFSTFINYSVLTLVVLVEGTESFCSNFSTCLFLLAAIWA